MSRSTESIGSLCKAKQDGQAKHVGVANFTTAMLDEAWAADERAAGDQPDRGASLPRPDQGDRGVPQARHVGHRLLPDRARQGPGNAGSSASARRTARARRRSRCAIWCSRASSRSRAPPTPEHLRANLACSTSRSACRDGRDRKRSSGRTAASSTRRTRRSGTVEGQRCSRRGQRRKNSGCRARHLGPARQGLRAPGRAGARGSAIATSTPRRCTTTSARWGRGCAPPA